jgi:hypothetical protein
MLLNFENNLDWGCDGNGIGISANEKVQWTKELIEIFDEEYYWDWEDLSSNAGVPWTMALIKQYESDIDFDRLCGHLPRPLLLEVIDSVEYMDRIYSLGWHYVCERNVINFSQNFYRSHQIKFDNLISNHHDFNARKLTSSQIDELLGHLFLKK